MRKLRCRKALSPVIAAIILIAVTVAVSIAVAAWMGALTIGFMGGAEQLKIIEVRFPATGTMTVEVQNTGPTTVTILEIRVDGTTKNISSVSANLVLVPADGKYTLDKGKGGIFTISFAWNAGTPYDIAVKTTKQLYTYPANAPS